MKLDWRRLFSRAQPRPSEEATDALVEATRQRERMRRSAEKWRRHEESNGFAELVEGLLRNDK